MSFGDIQESLGAPTVDALLMTLLSVLSDDQDDSQYVERVQALQKMLTAALALCMTRSGRPRAEAERLMLAQLRAAVDRIERAEIASRETGVLADVPPEWRATLSARR